MHSAATAFEKQKATPVSQPLKDIEASQGSSSSVPGQQLSFQVEDASTHEASTSVPQQAWEWIQRLMQPIWTSGVACGVLSSAIMAANALLVKLVSDEVPVFQIVLARSIITCSTTFIIAKAAAISPLYGQRKHYAWLTARGLCGTTAMTLYYGALHYLPLADAITLSKVSPVLTALLAAVVVGERLSLASFFCSCAGLVGVAFTAHPPFLFGGSVEWSQQRLLGVMLDLASATATAGAYICIRHIQTSEPALTVAMWFHTTSLVTSIIPLAVGIPDFPVIPNLTACLVLLAIGFTSFIGQLFLGRSYQIGSAGRISAIDYTQVVYGHVAGVLLLHEKESWFGLLGTTLIACGAVGANLFKPKPTAQDTGGTQTSNKAEEAANGEESSHLLNSNTSHEEDIGQEIDLEGPRRPNQSSWQLEHVQAHAQSDSPALPLQGSDAVQNSVRELHIQHAAELQGSSSRENSERQ